MRTPLVWTIVVSFVCGCSLAANRCGDGWLEYSSSCYKKMAAPNGWLGARHDCVWEGGDLVSIASKAEEDFVKRTMGEKTRFWLGLSNLKCSEVWCHLERGHQAWTWSDTRLTAAYTNWAQSQPESPNVESCVYVNQWVNRESGMWRSGLCASSLAYMCERPLTGCPEGRTCHNKDDGYGFIPVETSACDAGELLYGKYCYGYEETKRTWEEAEKFCVARGGHLPSVHSSKDAKWLFDHIWNNAFVGLKKNKNNNYEWSDGTPFDYRVWYDNKPGDCSLTYEKLYAYHCLSTWPFFCQKAKRQVPPPQQPPGWTDKCGWWADNPSNDFCYLLNREATKTWTQAQNDCQRLRGNLLSITDLPEQNFVYGYFEALLTGPSLWLGASLSTAKDGAKWADGSPFSFVHLDAGNPGDTSAGLCLSLVTGSGYWKADYCENSKGYICKRRGQGKTQKRLLPHDDFVEMVVCQNESQSIACPAARVVRIQSAFYGRRRSDVCSHQPGSDGKCMMENVRPHYSEVCDNHQGCYFRPLESDSCPAVSKYLHIVYSCKENVCLDSLVTKNGRVTGSPFSASSSLKRSEANEARLDGKHCWIPSAKPTDSWIQVDLRQSRVVMGIVTQGCKYTSHSEWSSKLQMQFSSDGTTWTNHPDGKMTTGETLLLDMSMPARYIRIQPLENHPNFGLRFDVLGCALDDYTQGAETSCASTPTSLGFTGPVTVYCPPGCANSSHTVYGTVIYDQGSHICAAAIHAGVIRNELGGVVTLVNAPPQTTYAGSTSNWITSKQYDDEISFSYTFMDGEPRCSRYDWVEFADLCYKRFENKNTWNHAQTICRNLGAQLVSIYSAVDQAWLEQVMKLTNSDMWTGLNDLVVRGEFKWPDQSEVTFTNWDRGQPIDSYEKGCVATLNQSGRWKKMLCTVRNSFMCYKPKDFYAIGSVKSVVGPASPAAQLGMTTVSPRTTSTKTTTTQPPTTKTTTTRPPTTKTTTTRPPTTKTTTTRPPTTRPTKRATIKQTNQRSFWEDLKISPSTAWALAWALAKDYFVGN